MDRMDRCRLGGWGGATPAVQKSGSCIAPSSRNRYHFAGMSLRRSSIFLRRLVRVEGRKVIARFLTRPERAAVMTFATHGDARRAASKLVVQLRLARSDEEYDEQLRFRVELVRAYSVLEEESGSGD